MFQNPNMIFMDGYIQKFSNDLFQVLDVNTYHSFRYFPNYEWLSPVSIPDAWWIIADKSYD